MLSRPRTLYRGSRYSIRPDKQGIETTNLQPRHHPARHHVTASAPINRGLKRRRRGRPSRKIPRACYSIRPDKQGIETGRFARKLQRPRDGYSIRPDKQGIETPLSMYFTLFRMTGSYSIRPDKQGIETIEHSPRSAASACGYSIRPDKQGIETSRIGRPNHTVRGVGYSIRPDKQGIETHAPRSSSTMDSLSLQHPPR